VLSYFSLSVTDVVVVLPDLRYSIPTLLLGGCLRISAISATPS
jgi:hypothetical protein